MSERSLIVYSAAVTAARPTRAQPLPAEDRRRAIVTAVLPLLVREGASVTTRQLAEAAGVAEGTLFRVFPDKHALIRHALEHVMDPAPVREALAEIHSGAELEVQLAEAARILLERTDEVMALFGVARTLGPGKEHRPSKVPSFVADFHREVVAGLTELFERHRGELSIEPARAAVAFRSLLFARASLPAAENLTVQEIVEVLLSGVARSRPRVS